MSLGPKRECVDCSAPVSAKSKGRCRRCAGRAVGESNAQPKRLLPCQHCGRAFAYEAGRRERFCSWGCYAAGKVTPTAEEHHSWKGDDVGRWAGWSRAKRMFPTEPCEICGVADGVRHHVDGNNLNNVRENIRFLCRSHHAALHHEQGDLVLPPSAR